MAEDNVILHGGEDSPGVSILKERLALAGICMTAGILLALIIHR